MSYQPLVSIVVPVYNAEEYVDETIRSLLTQTYKSIEIIAIDDGSTDKSFNILQKYSGQIHIEKQANAGQAATINKGWGQSKGDIIGYLSADDVLKPECISNLVAELKKNSELGAVYPDFDLIDGKSQYIRKVSAPEFDYMKLVQFLECSPGPGLIFYKSFFEKFGGWDTSLHQLPDFEYWLRIGGSCRFKRVQKSLAQFRIHNESQSYIVSSIKKAEEPIAVMKQYFSLLTNNDSRNYLKAKSLANAHLLSARLHLRASRWTLGLSHIFSSVKCDLRTIFTYRSVRIILSGIFGRLYYRLTSALNKSR